MRLSGSPSSITAIAAVMCALAFPSSASADTITVGWDPHPDATVVGYMLYVEGPSGYSRTFDVGLSVVFPFAEAVAGQQYCFAVASYAAGPRVGPPSSPVCGYSDMAPVFAGVSDRSTEVGQAVSLQLNADDPEESPLTYTATGLPPGLTLQSSTGFISGTPTIVGTYNVTATARDESLSSVQTFTWSIVAPGGAALSTSATTGGALRLTSLAADRPAPQPAGSSITFTATVAGGASPHQYKWWVHDDSGWRVMRNWAQGNTWTWTPTVANSGYQVSVWVRNATTTADTYENNQSSGIIDFPIGGTSQAPPPATPSSTPSAGPLTLTSLAADRPAPQPAGSTITFTATASGGASPYQYKWWLNAGSGWYVARDWAQGNTWTWTPWVVNSGYQVSVWVRNATTTADTYENNQSSGIINFPIGGTSQAPPPATPSSTPSAGPLTLTSLAADRPAPQPAGSSITFTAAASGGASPYQYKWWIYDGANWIIAQQWTTSNRWTWTPSAGNSSYRVAVWVRNAGSSTDVYDNSGSSGSLAYPISAASTSSPTPSTTTSGGVLTLTSIGGDRVAPQPAGTSIVFTASATGGSSPYQYKWWLYDGANWIQRSDWSTSNSWTWTPSAANSAYIVGVWIRNAGSTVDTAAAVGSMPFAITSGSTPTTAPSTSGPLKLTGISSSRGAPSPVGVSVQFTAQISGGAAPQQYKWWLFDGAMWYQMTGWSTSNTWSWAPPSANSFQVGVWVRNAGSSADAADSSEAVGAIAFQVY
jgi:hypothetical protein